MQRFQSICMLIVTILAALSLVLPLKSIRNQTHFDVLNNYLVMKWLIISIAAISLVNIFLYFNRPLQMKVCLVNLFLVLISAAMLYNYKEEADRNQLLFFNSFFLLPISEGILLLVAYIGILKDHKLVTDADRLR